MFIHPTQTHSVLNAILFFKGFENKIKLERIFILLVMKMSAASEAESMHFMSNFLFLPKNNIQKTMFRFWPIWFGIGYGATDKNKSLKKLFLLLL